MILVIRESGLREVLTGFRRLEGTVTDLREVWPDVSETFHEIEEDQFSTEGARGEEDQFSTEGARGVSGKWKDLSEKYAKWKAKHFPGRKILERTGALRESLTGISGFTKREDRMRYVEESTVPYGIYHATGTGVMPQRSPVSITEADARQFGAVIGRYIQKDIRKHFAGAA